MVKKLPRVSNVVVVGYVGFSPWMLENIYAAYSGLKSQATAMYLLPYFSTLTYNYFGSTTLWSMIDATGEMTRAEMLEFYYGHNAQMFMRKALRAHPTGFCVLNAPIELNLLNNKADIVGYFDKQTLDDLMEYLAGLYTAKVEIFAVEEFHLYGSSRLGVHKTKFTLVETDEEETIIFEAEVDMEYKQHYIGQKGFELSNHLGNVLVVVTDRPIPVEDTLVSGTVGYFEAEIISISDYYAFGSSMPTRSWTDVNRGYRFGFGGHERVDEVSGSGNTVDMGDRWLDVRLGRTPKMDAKADVYPGISPYAYALNTPIWAYDPDGRLVIFVNGLRPSKGAADQMPIMGGGGIYNKNNAGALRDYWRTDKNAFGRKADIAGMFMSRLKDDNAYFTSGSSTFDSQAKANWLERNILGVRSRYHEGISKADKFHKMVQKGKITLADGETIKIVTHSQGGAHGEGMATRLIELGYTVEVIYNG